MRTGRSFFFFKVIFEAWYADIYPFKDAAFCLNKSWKQHPTKLQMYSYLPPISQIIKVRCTRHAGYCCRSKDKLVSEVLLWTLTHGHTCVDWPAKIYIHQLYADIGCQVKGIFAINITWWSLQGGYLTAF